MKHNVISRRTQSPKYVEEDIVIQSTEPEIVTFDDVPNLVYPKAPKVKPLKLNKHQKTEESSNSPKNNEFSSFLQASQMCLTTKQLSLSFHQQKKSHNISDLIEILNTPEIQIAAKK